MENILSQTVPVTELILIDDGSSDDTQECIAHYMETSPRWRERVLHLHQKNQGPSAARNAGIAKARGEWLAFIDDDDLWLPQKLEWQFRALDQFKGKCDVCITDAWFMNNPRMKMTLFQLAGKRHGDNIGIIEDPLEYMLETNSITGVHSVWVQNLVTRTELARRVGGFDQQLRCGEDDDFVFRLGCETKFCFVNVPMVLIDRTPPAERHVGENKRWDEEGFRLEMAQRRYEKRLSMSHRFDDRIRNRIRKDLAAVHSGWANWFLEKRQYAKAHRAAAEAARMYFAPNLAAKWVLTRSLPGIARKLSLIREEQRRRKTVGMG